MKKILYLLIAVFLIAINSVCFANDISKSYDQFNKTLTLKSQQKYQLSNTQYPELEVTLAKHYTFTGEFWDKKKKQFKPTYDLMFSITAKEYYFFQKKFQYIVGNDFNVKSRSLYTSYSKNPASPVTFAALPIFSLNDTILKDLQKGEPIKIRLLFSNKGPVDFLLTADALKQWEPIFKYDMYTDPEYLARLKAVQQQK